MVTKNGTYYENITNKESDYLVLSSTTEWGPEALELLQNYYSDNLGTAMPFPIADLVARAAKAGMTVEAVMLAIDETMFAPRPSPHYLRAILTRWLGAGVHTAAQVAADKEAHQARTARRRRDRWAGFDQREYKAGELDVFVKFNGNEM